MVVFLVWLTDKFNYAKNRANLYESTLNVFRLTKFIDSSKLLGHWPSEYEVRSCLRFNVSLYVYLYELCSLPRLSFQKYFHRSLGRYFVSSVCHLFGCICMFFPLFYQNCDCEPFVKGYFSVVHKLLCLWYNVNIITLL